MRFLLRCVFWLSVVYTSILSDLGGRGAATGRDDVVRAARAAIAVPAQAAGEAAAGLSAYCRREPSTCLADSARLTALVAASDDGAGDIVGHDEPVPALRRQPLPQPRGRARGAMQARTP